MDARLRTIVSVAVLHSTQCMGSPTKPDYWRSALLQLSSLPQAIAEDRMTQVLLRQGIKERARIPTVPECRVINNRVAKLLRVSRHEHSAASTALTFRSSASTSSEGRPFLKWAGLIVRLREKFSGWSSCNILVTSPLCSQRVDLVSASVCRLTQLTLLIGERDDKFHRLSPRLQPSARVPNGGSSCIAHHFPHGLHHRTRLYFSLPLNQPGVATIPPWLRVWIASRTSLHSSYVSPVIKARRSALPRIDAPFLLHSCLFYSRRPSKPISALLQVHTGSARTTGHGLPFLPCPGLRSVHPFCCPHSSYGCMERRLVNLSCTRWVPESGCPDPHESR